MGKKTTWKEKTYYLPYLVSQSIKNQNSLRNSDIDKIVNAYDQYQDIEKYARVVDLKEIEENEFNLNITRYIDRSEAREVVDVKAVWKEIQELEAERQDVNKKISNYLKELGY